MERKLMRELYTRTVAARNIQPNEAEEKEWHMVLGDQKYSDLDAALRRWANDITIEDFTGRPRGARMPKAAELKASIVAFDKEQKRPKDSFRGCRECNGTGWIPTGQDRRVKRCPCFYVWARGA